VRVLGVVDCIAQAIAAEAQQGADPLHAFARLVDLGRRIDIRLELAACPLDLLRSDAAKAFLDRLVQAKSKGHEGVRWLLARVILESIMGTADDFPWWCAPKVSLAGQFTM